MTRDDAIDLLDHHKDDLVAVAVTFLEEKFSHLAETLNIEAERLNFRNLISEQQVEKINDVLFRQLARIPNTLDIRNMLTEVVHPIDWILDFDEIVLPTMEEKLLK